MSIVLGPLAPLTWVAANANKICACGEFYDDSHKENCLPFLINGFPFEDGTCTFDTEVNGAFVLVYGRWILFSSGDGNKQT